MAPSRRIRAVSRPHRPGRRGPGRSGAAAVAPAPGRSSGDGPETDRYSLPFLLAPPDLWVMHSPEGEGEDAIISSNALEEKEDGDQGRGLASLPLPLGAAGRAQRGRVRARAAPALLTASEHGATLGETPAGRRLRGVHAATSEGVDAPKESSHASPARTGRDWP